MAHTITGIDLGSHAVKFVTIEVGFRQSRFVSSFEERVPPGEAPLAERQGEALAAGLLRLPEEQTFFVAMPGDGLAVRVLDLPFSDARKIDQVVAFELEGQIVHALDEVVFDHTVSAAPGEGGSSVLAAAARLDDVASLLAELKARNVEPRSVFAAPLMYKALVAPPLAEPEASPGCQLVIDVGHQRTNLCFLWRREAVFARTVVRGGAALTAAVARAFRCDEPQAELLKHEQGFLATAARPAASATERQMDAALREALVPLLREIRQTIASQRARSKVPIDGVLLTGGTAALAGLGEFLAEELELPVVPWAGSEAAEAGPDPAPVLETADPRFVLARAIAWSGARGEREIDLRKGPFVYKANFSILRQKAAHLMALAAAVLISVTIDATMKMTRLGSERDKLEAELKAATQELFGAPRYDGREVARLLKRSFKDEMAPLPKATAFDLLEQVSSKMPPADIKLDVTDFDVKPKKLSIAGTVGSAAAVDDIVARLKQIECLAGDEPSRGPISEVSGGARKFSLTFKSKCP
jgi:Tfp pilus assembly PilM family ATPase